MKYYDGRDNTDDGEFEECMNAISATVGAHDKTTDETNETEVYISLVSEMEALEAISFGQKSMTEAIIEKPVEKTEF